VTLTPDEKLVLKVAAERLEEYVTLDRGLDVYDYGTQNLIRDLRKMVGDNSPPRGCCQVHDGDHVLNIECRGWVKA